MGDGRKYVGHVLPQFVSEWCGSEGRQDMRTAGPECGHRKRHGGHRSGVFLVWTTSSVNRHRSLLAIRVAGGVRRPHQILQRGDLQRMLKNVSKTYLPLKTLATVNSSSAKYLCDFIESFNVMLARVRNRSYTYYRIPEDKSCFEIQVNLLELVAKYLPIVSLSDISRLWNQ
ncbi:hypothetical protein J6590_011388 [Homalodisca vitripennis]|nr:hypothetical protein J6590_011388 [Homalodisca vitripennis]